MDRARDEMTKLIGALVVLALAAALSVTGSIASPRAAFASTDGDIDTEPAPYLMVNPTLPAGLAGTGQAGGEPSVLLIGDSTLASLVWYSSTAAALQPLAYTLDAKSCRAVTGPSCRGRVDLAGTIHLTPTNAAEAMTAYGPGHFDELVLMAGYDEPGSRFAESVQTIPVLAKQLGIRHITWLTFRTDVPYVPPAEAALDHSYTSNNSLLLQAAQTSKGYISLLDWNTFAAGHPELLEADGIHLRKPGAQVLGTFIRRAVQELWEPRISAAPASLVHAQRTPTASGFEFAPSPTRVLDTRRLGDVEGGESYRLSDLPVPAGATGALVSVTAVHPESDGYLTVYPCTAEVPATSTVNFATFDDRSTVTVAALDADHGFCVYSSVHTDVVVDLQGWSTPTTDVVPQPFAPRRALDTRTVGRLFPVAAPTAVRVPVGGPGVLLNVTVTQPTADGYVTIYPSQADASCGLPPTTSNVTFHAGDTTSARVDLPAPAGADGTGVVCAWSLVATHLVIDETASYRHDPAGWITSAPVRALDTRTVGRRGRVVVIPTAAASGGAVSVGLTVAAVNPAVDAFVTVYPAQPDGSCGTAPTASLVNPEAGTVRANSTVVDARAGVVCAYASTPVDLVVDLVGSASS
jgi:hypothetical protein